MARVLSSGHKQETTSKIHETASVNKFNEKPQEQPSLFSSLKEMTLPESYKQKIIQQSRDLGSSIFDTQDDDIEDAKKNDGQR